MNQPVNMKSSFTDLVEKYLSGNITDEEQLRLLEEMEKEENRPVLNSMIDAALHRQAAGGPVNKRLADISYQMLDVKISQHESNQAAAVVTMPVAGRRMQGRKYFVVAASILVVVCAGFYFMLNRSYDKMPDKSPAGLVAAGVYTRHIVLPDSSVVVLHANSSIRLPEGFNTRAREIALTGEAYFDVRHDAGRPFVVHTGIVKTTVLGTAFNIKAYPGMRQVIVSVTRGKVRVEDNKKTIATLTHDGQVTYTLKDESTAEQSIDAGTVVTDWTKKDVVFESISFREIAGILSKRYGVVIKFSNEALKDCHVRTSFKGIEPLNEMLDLLCTAMNASYKRNADNEIVINTIQP